MVPNFLRLKTLAVFNVRIYHRSKVVLTAHHSLAGSFAYKALDLSKFFPLPHMQTDVTVKGVLRRIEDLGIEAIAAQMDAGVTSLTIYDGV